jgi:hypothetical protein
LRRKWSEAGANGLERIGVAVDADYPLDASLEECECVSPAAERAIQD